MPRVNIYLPDDMAAEVREAEQLSVSSVCQRAIRKELDRLNAQREATRDIEAVAARLRGTVTEEDAVLRQEGYEDGISWAREWATASELRFIATDWEPGRGGDLQLGQGCDSLVEFSGEKAGGNGFGIRAEEGDPYWDGFINGAGEVLEQVKPLL